MKRISWIIACMVIGAGGASYAQPYMGHNSDIVLIIATVFSVFAGFLIAVITIIGDPIMIQEGSWRVAEVGHDSMRGRLFAHIALFILYLITLASLFIAVVVDKAFECPHSVKSITEWVYLFFSITAFLLTFALPISLWNMQKARYEAEIERRRSQAGIIPG